MRDEELGPAVAALSAVLPRAFPAMSWGSERVRRDAARWLLVELREDGWGLTRADGDDAADRGRWPLTFSCPRCGHAVQDAYGEGWCMVCKAHTGPLPEGLRS